jgi:penicillin-binding protein 1A
MGFTRESAFYYLTSKGKAGWNWYKHLYQRSPWYKKTLIVVLTFIASFIIYLGMVDVNFLWLFGKSPGLSSIHNPDQPIASEIYSEDGKLIGNSSARTARPLNTKRSLPY